jgi:hypothetical protein
MLAFFEFFVLSRWMMANANRRTYKCGHFERSREAYIRTFLLEDGKVVYKNSLKHVTNNRKWELLLFGFALDKYISVIECESIPHVERWTLE